MLPASLPIRLAAAITGRSEPSFRRDVLPRVLGDDGRVSSSLLEREMGREVPAEEYVAAQARLDGRRRRERGYRGSGDGRHRC